MMDSLSESLKGLQVVDQAPLKSALGLLQGSQVHDTASAFSILVGGTPGTVTTADKSIETTGDNTTTANSGTSAGTTSQSLENVIDNKIDQKLGLTKQTTVAARAPTQPTLPDLIASPSQSPAFGQNALDLLSDQVNLTYQIFNVRMLLERSLNDRLQTDGTPRLQAVLGFNVSLDPPHNATDSAAVVEITITPTNDNSASLVALMPQEKTYNSVALNSKSNAFGGSAVVKMVTVGYTQRRRGQTYYLYRDNDTLSFERMKKEDCNDLTVGWEFRPVLGRKSVSAGMRQMFAVVSIPASDATAATSPVDLKVTVKTYWRKYYGSSLTTSDRSKIGGWPYIGKVASLGLSETVPNGIVMSRKDSVVQVPTTTFYQDKLRPKVSDVSWSQVDDKTALISVSGENFFNGTSVVMGGSTATTNVFVKSNQAMDVLTPLENIGAGNAMIIGRYGSAVPLVVDGCDPEIVGGSVSTAFAQQREVRLTVANCAKKIYDNPLSVFANGRHVPGFPSVIWDTASPKCSAANPCAVIIAHIPNDLFPKDGTVSVVSPFRKNYRISFPWYDNSDAYDVQRASGKTNTVFYIKRKDGLSLTSDFFFGTGAKDRWKVEVEGTSIKPNLDSPKVMRVEITKPDVDGVLALYEPIKDSVNTNLYLLDIPPAKAKAKVAIEAASGTSLSVSQNDAPKLDFSGEKVDAVTSVKIEGQDNLHFDYDADKKILSVYITSAVTKSPAKLTLQFRDSSSKLIAAVTLEVKALPKQQSGTKSFDPKQSKKGKG